MLDNTAGAGPPWECRMPTFVSLSRFPRICWLITRDLGGDSLPLFAVTFLWFLWLKVARGGVLGSRGGCGFGRGGDDGATLMHERIVTLPTGSLVLIRLIRGRCPGLELLSLPFRLSLPLVAGVIEV